MIFIQKCEILRMKDYLIGSISGNYTVNNVKTWIETSNDFENVERVLFLYNDNNTELKSFCIKNNITLIVPDFDFYGNPISEFIADSGKLTPENSHKLIHHIRFLHYAIFLKDIDENARVLLTDVNDVKFQSNPFNHPRFSSHSGIIATSEEISFEREKWNLGCLDATLGLFGMGEIRGMKINCAGVIGGSANNLVDICKDIYLMCIGKPRNADQIAFNYLINTRYKNVTSFSGINNNFAIHLHVIAHKLIPFDLSNLNNYSIIHQYDRL